MALKQPSGSEISHMNDQWRICFEWPSGSAGPANVEIVDYHVERLWRFMQCTLVSIWQMSWRNWA